MTDTLEILDGGCGTGKTTGIFEWMKYKRGNFLYVTPFVSETKRAMLDLEGLDINVPIEDKNAKTTKTESLLELLMEKRNIACTHSLFKKMTPLHMEAIKGYTIIIDEECDLIEPFSGDYNSQDLQFLIDKNCVKIDYDNLGRIEWISESEKHYYNDKYAHFRNMCNLGMLYCSKSSRDCLTVHLPIELISSSERVILISYRFKYSIMNHFVQMKGLKVIPFTEVKLTNFDKKILQEKIEVIRFKNEKHYTKPTILSTNWYQSVRQEELDDIAKIIYGICKNQKKIKSDVMWTVPSKYVIGVSSNAKKLTVPSYGAMSDDENKLGCFVACSAKAVNEFSDKNMLVHAYNRYPNQILLIYLRDYGFKIDSNEFALSEMIQWVFRSRIRKGESIKICIISKRMRDLFVNWLNEI